MYSKKAVESANKGTEAAEEPTRSLTVSMPLGEFKWAITQRGFSVNRFVEDININLLVVFFCNWTNHCFLRLPRFFLKTWLLLSTWEVPAWLSLGCLACLKLEPDDQVSNEYAPFNGVEKKIRDVFFDKPIEVNLLSGYVVCSCCRHLFKEFLLGAK